MKMVNGLFIIIFLSAAQGVERNPFIVPISPCENLLTRLDNWRLHGILHLDGESIALMNRAGSVWMRVKMGQRLEPDVSVSGMSEKQLSVPLTNQCPGAFYHWNLQGREYDKDAVHHSVNAFAIGQQGK